MLKSGHRAFGVALLLFALLASAYPAMAATAPSGVGCLELGGSTVGCDAGGGGVGVVPPGPPEGEVTGPRRCNYGQLTVPCTSYAGTWVGNCYVQAAEPQPALDDPIWEGQTTGAIVQCTPYPCLSAAGDAIPDCPTIARYWAAAAPVVVIDEAEIARRALANLPLAPITLGMAPKPDLADPNVLIGAPAYFWAEGGTPAIGPISTTVTEQGITITLNATMDTVTYTTGDGTTLTCTRDQIATPPTNMTLQGTPDCGHRWESSGTYTLTATSSWTITWQGPTQNGTFDHTLEAAIDVAVTDRPVNLTTNKSP